MIENLSLHIAIVRQNLLRAEGLWKFDARGRAVVSQSIQAVVESLEALLDPLPVGAAGKEGVGNQIGAAELAVGQHVYLRIEKLIDAKRGTLEGSELTYLAQLAEGVEEYGPSGEDMSVGDPVFVSAPPKQDGSLSARNDRQGLSATAHEHPSPNPPPGDRREAVARAEPVLPRIDTYWEWLCNAEQSGAINVRWPVSELRIILTKLATQTEALAKVDEILALLSPVDEGAVERAADLIAGLEVARDALARAPHGDNCFLHDDGGEYDRCFCGKDSVVAYLEGLLGEGSPDATEIEVEQAREVVRRALHAADNGNHAGEVAVVKMARAALSAAALPTQTAEAETPDEPCQRCQGNGEIVTDWDRYLGPAVPGDQGTEPCPDCDGSGRLPTQPGRAGDEEAWRPTHRHVKRGSSYQVIGTAMLQASDTVGEAAALVIYRGQKGDLWARPEVEFDDGRFEALTPQLPGVDGGLGA